MVVIIGLVGIGAAAIAVHYQRPIRIISSEDDSQTLLTYYHLPDRLVILDAAAGRLLDRLGQGPKIVGVSGELVADFPFVENLGAASQVDPLSILALRPDLVVLGKGSSALAAVLRRGGVNVFLVAPASLEQLLSGITRLGRVIGVESQATVIQEQLRARLTSLHQDGTAATGPPRVLFWVNEQFLAAGAGTFEDDLIKLIGGINVVTANGYVVFALSEANLSLPTAVFAPAIILQTLDPAQFAAVPSTPELGVGSGLLIPLTKLVAPPINFQEITWENVYERAEWLLQQIKG